MSNQALKVCEELETSGISSAHCNMRFVKPVDELLLHEVFGKFKHVITVEDGCIQGGMGSAVVEFMADNGYTSQIKRLGIPDKLAEHGTQDELYAECHYDMAAMVAAAVEMMGEKKQDAKKSA